MARGQAVDCYCADCVRGEGVLVVVYGGLPLNCSNNILPRISDFLLYIDWKAYTAAEEMHDICMYVTIIQQLVGSRGFKWSVGWLAVFMIQFSEIFKSLYPFRGHGR